MRSENYVDAGAGNLVKIEVAEGANPQAQQVQGDYGQIRAARTVWVLIVAVRGSSRVLSAEQCLLI
ncbi:MAG: hypothetical protein ACYSX1_09625 [Planctomycetota bacterium]